jgi:hypothetical protein
MEQTWYDKEIMKMCVEWLHKYIHFDGMEQTFLKTTRQHTKAHEQRCSTTHNCQFIIFLLSLKIRNKKHKEMPTTTPLIFHLWLL